MFSWSKFEGKLESVREMAAEREEDCQEMGGSESRLRRELVDSLAEKFFFTLLGEMERKFPRISHLCEEGVQDAFLKLFHKIEQIHSSEWKGVKAWLRTTARRAIVKKLKKEKKRKEFCQFLKKKKEDEEKFQSHEACEALLGSELHERLWDFLEEENLPSRERQVLTLQLLGYSRAKIERALGLSRDNLRQIIWRLRKSLREFLFTGKGE